MGWWKRVLDEDSGATAVEYAVMLALIILTCLGAISTFGTGQGVRWGGIDSELDAHGI